MRALFRRVPEQIGGRSIPRRFRRWSIHFADPGSVVADFVAWLEAENSLEGTVNAAPTEAERKRQREALVAACIEVRERIESTALRRRLETALQTAGVVAFTCDGQRFEPEHHEALGWVRSGEPSQENTIAATVEPGYRDGDRIVHQPRVEVYRVDARDGS